MSSTIDLKGHFSITKSNEISEIIKPLLRSFGIKHFRYLRLYYDGSRIILSNYPDCTRFMYEHDNYKQMWFDGEFPELLTEGCHIWDVVKVTQTSKISAFEEEINKSLGLYHGMTFVKPGLNFYEIYTFDSDNPSLYQIDRSIFAHFILYFKEQARALIKQGENEKLYVSLKHSLHKKYPQDEQLIQFIENTRISRYYLGGKYEGSYLTSKEMQCIYWLIQGKTAEEIAIIEKNSTKTIARHLENVRRKFNCYKQTQLVQIILEAGVFTSSEFNIRS